MVRLFQVSADKEGIRLKVQIENDQELPGAAVSAVRVALSNLLLNALQATPRGGEVAITERIEDDNLVIVVEDGGPGIAADLRKRIWEPFFTTKQRGTGLGLAIVRKRLQEAGGTARLIPRLTARAQLLNCAFRCRPASRSERMLPLKLRSRFEWFSILRTLLQLPQASARYHHPKRAARLGIPVRSRFCKHSAVAALAGTFREERAC